MPRVNLYTVLRQIFLSVIQTCVLAKNFWLRILHEHLILTSHHLIQPTQNESFYQQNRIFDKNLSKYLDKDDILKTMNSLLRSFGGTLKGTIRGFLKTSTFRPKQKLTTAPFKILPLILERSLVKSHFDCVFHWRLSFFAWLASLLLLFEALIK